MKAACLVFRMRKGGGLMKMGKISERFPVLSTVKLG